jgi:hypothetical protein
MKHSTAAPEEQQIEELKYGADYGFRPETGSGTQGFPSDPLNKYVRSKLSICIE